MSSAVAGSALTSGDRGGGGDGVTLAGPGAVLAAAADDDGRRWHWRWRWCWHWHWHWRIGRDGPGVPVDSTSIVAFFSKNSIISSRDRSPSVRPPTTSPSTLRAAIVACGRRSRSGGGKRSRVRGAPSSRRRVRLWAQAGHAVTRPRAAPPASPPLRPPPPPPLPWVHDRLATRLKRRAKKRAWPH